MSLSCISVSCEQTMGNQVGGEYYVGDTLCLMGSLIEKYAGQAKCVYLDPPFLTGQSFQMAVKAGEEDWRKMRGSIRVRTFDDKESPEEYFGFLRQVLAGVKELMCEEGAVFLHVDYRANARLRLIADEIFGEENFVNEIIWSYKSGGRARNSFPHKHDDILFYRKSKKLTFDINAVLEKRDVPPDNHMRRHVDPDGRVYRSIRSNGRVYTYYDDDPVAPTDVWDDISHLQQKDYERTGYDTQKPLKLLKRIVCSTTAPGDLVMDLLAGSGTTLEAARRDGRRFVGVDQCPLTVNILRRRLAGAPVRFVLPASPSGGARCQARAFCGVGMYEIELEEFELEEPVFGKNGFDAVDNWSAGYLEDGVFREAAHFARSLAHPGLRPRLGMPAYDGLPVVRVGTLDGLSRFFTVDKPAQNG